MLLKNLDEGTFVSIQEWEKVGCNEKGIDRSILLGYILANKRESGYNQTRTSA